MAEQLPLLIWMISILALSGVLFRMNLFSFIDNNITGRIPQIDGLRFFLAIFVAFHHFGFSYMNFHGKPWIYSTLNNYPVNQQIGQLGVAFFFMISGFVFANLSPGRWGVFFYKRFFRIAPLSLLSSLLCIIIALWIQRNHIDNTNVLEKIYFWLDAGLTGQKPDLFGLSGTSHINAGVTWSLFWEWAFYFSLPLVVLIRDKIGIFALCASVIFFSVYILPNFNQTYAAFISFFAVGFLAREVSQKLSVNKLYCDLGIIITLGLLFGISKSPYNVYYLPLLTAFFFFVTLGGDIFGILRLKSFIRLGDASYSIYLLHGIFWFALNKIILSTGVSLSTNEYMLASTLTILLMLITSTLTYRFIEIPFINISKRII